MLLVPHLERLAEKVAEKSSGWGVTDAWTYVQFPPRVAIDTLP